MSFALRPVRLAAAVIAASLSAVGTAYASGFALMEQNASGLGNAYAGQAAAAEDASTIFFNPAGMTNIRGRQVVGALHAIDTGGKFNNDGSTPPQPAAALGHPLGGDGGDPGDLSFVPSGYISWELEHGQVWVGLGLGVPFGLKTDYDDNWMGRFHATYSEVKSLNINPTVAWKVNDFVSAGVGVNMQKFEATLKNQVSYRAIALRAGAGALVPAGTEGEATVEGDDWGFGWNAGLMFNLGANTRLGLSYRSSIEYDLRGRVSFENRPAVLAAGLPNGSIEAEVEVPDSFSIGFSHFFTPRLQLLADYTWTGWDSIQTLLVNRTTGGEVTRLDLNFEDSWRAGVGLNYQFNDAWKLRMGVAVDKTPVEDEFRTPRLPDGDRLWLAVGAQWQFSPAGAIDFGYAFVQPDDTDIDLPNTTATSTLPRGNLSGDFEDADVHVFSVQMRYSF